MIQDPDTVLLRFHDPGSGYSSYQISGSKIRINFSEGQFHQGRRGNLFLGIVEYFSGLFFTLVSAINFNLFHLSPGGYCTPSPALNIKHYSTKGTVQCTPSPALNIKHYSTKGTVQCTPSPALKIKHYFTKGTV